MNRLRRLLVLALALHATVARAQGTPARIAYLNAGSARSATVFLDAFRQGLAENGLVEDRDVVLDFGWAEGDYERFPVLMAELMQRQPSVIVVSTIAAVRAAQDATKTLPIVMVAINDPVGAGLISSLSLPGGNTTGSANMVEDVTPKLLEILHLAIPRATDIAVLFNPANPGNRSLYQSTRSAAARFGIKVRPVEFTAGEALAGDFATLMRQPPGGLLVVADSAIVNQRDRIVALALQHRLPTMTHFSEFAAAGALIGYGPSRRTLFRRAAIYVKKILAGAKPAELPVEQPTTFELVINLKTAKAIGITIPRSLLLRADEVIE